MTTEAPTEAVDHVALLRSKQYRGLLVVAALLGVVVSAASWAFLELVEVIQEAVYEQLPSGLGYDEIPWWWLLPVLAIAGGITANAIVRLPGNGVHLPYGGIKAGAANPVDLPGCRSGDRSSHHHLDRRRLHRDARDLVGTRKPARGRATSGCEQVTDHTRRTWAASGRDPDLALEAS